MSFMEVTIFLVGQTDTCAPEIKDKRVQYPYYICIYIVKQPLSIEQF